jgi:hypothetical protein
MAKTRAETASRVSGSAGRLPPISPVEVMALLESDQQALTSRLAAESKAYFARDRLLGKIENLKQDALRRSTVGAAFDALAQELIRIGRAQEFTVLEGKDSSGDYDWSNRHRTAHDIGRLLYDAGGMNLMRAAYF